MSNADYLYFTGISPVYLDEKKSDEILLKDASESAADYESVFGFTGIITEKASSGTRTGTTFNFIYSNKAYTYYMEKLEKYISCRENDAVYRIYRIESDVLMPDIEKSEKGSEPGWISKTPQIEGIFIQYWCIRKVQQDF